MLQGTQKDISHLVFNPFVHSEQLISNCYRILIIILIVICFKCFYCTHSHIQVKQTLYHVYVVDTSTEKEWEHWQPKPKQHRPTEVDMSADGLIIQGQPFPCVNGYSWVDMSVLIEECYEIVSSKEIVSGKNYLCILLWTITIMVSPYVTLFGCLTIITVIFLTQVCVL